jgi:hypothetical protein
MQRLCMKVETKNNSLQATMTRIFPPRHHSLAHVLKISYVHRANRTRKERPAGKQASLHTARRSPDPLREIPIERYYGRYILRLI